MVSKESRAKVRLNKHRRMRNRFAGTAERPRLASQESFSYTFIVAQRRALLSM